CLCKRNNYFVGVDCIWLPRRCGIVNEKIFDQFDHHAVEARALFVVLGFWHGRLLLTAHSRLANDQKPGVRGLSLSCACARRGVWAINCEAPSLSWSPNCMMLKRYGCRRFDLVH